MDEVITIGVYLAKNVFQVHGVDAEGAVVFRRQLRRGRVLPFFKKQRPCLVGMEACATSHHWGREIEALGHSVRLMAVPSINSIRRRNPGILGVPATGLAGCTEGRPVDDEARCLKLSHGTTAKAERTP